MTELDKQEMLLYNSDLPYSLVLLLSIDLVIARVLEAFENANN